MFQGLRHSSQPETTFDENEELTEGEGCSRELLSCKGDHADDSSPPIGTAKTVEIARASSDLTLDLDRVHDLCQTCLDLLATSC